MDHIYLHMDRIYLHMDHAYLHIDHIYLHNRLLLILSKVYHLIHDRWKGELNNCFYTTEFSMQGRVVLWGSRIIIRPQGRKTIIKKPWKPSLYWMDKKNSQKFGSQAPISSWRKQQYRARRVKWEEPASTWPWPQKPWSRIYDDFTDLFMGMMLLVVVDAHSKWIEAILVYTSTSWSMISKLHDIFSTHDLPEVLVMDNRSNFTSAEFIVFLKKKNFMKHICTVP